MANIEDLLDLLDLNDNVEEEVPDGVRYVNLLAELRPNINEALLLLNDFTLMLGLGFGQYGSINLGSKGAVYKQVRGYLLRQQQLLNLPILRRYLTEPLVHLPAYVRAGPGGQGDSKIALNTCWGMIRDRVQRVLGMMVVLQTNEPGEFPAPQPVV